MQEVAGPPSDMMYIPSIPFEFQFDESHNPEAQMYSHDVSWYSHLTHDTETSCSLV